MFSVYHTVTDGFASVHLSDHSANLTKHLAQEEREERAELLGTPDSADFRVKFFYNWRAL